MRIGQGVFRALMLLPIFFTTLCLFWLPNQIPVHYDLSGQITRWGSRYEVLILPVIIVIFGLVLQGVSSVAAKQEGQGDNNRRIATMVGIVALITLNAVQIALLATCFYQSNQVSVGAVDWWSMTTILLGCAMLVVGNVMPKIRLNSVMGLRTVWSMKNETTWKKSQRFGGIALMIAGVGMVVTACITAGMLCAALSLALLILSVVVSVCYSYVVAQKY